MAGKLIEYPFDTVKVYLSLQCGGVDGRFDYRLSQMDGRLSFVVLSTAFSKLSNMRGSVDSTEYLSSISRN